MQSISWSKTQTSLKDSIFKQNVSQSFWTLKNNLCSTSHCKILTSTRSTCCWRPWSRRRMALSQMFWLTDGSSKRCNSVSTSNHCSSAKFALKKWPKRSSQISIITLFFTGTAKWSQNKLKFPTQNSFGEIACIRTYSVRTWGIEMVKGNPKLRYSTTLT